MAKTGPKSKSSVHSAPGVIPPEDAKALKKELKKKTQGLEIDDFGAIASRAALKNQPPAAAKTQTKIPKLDKAAVKPRSRKTVSPDEEEGATGDGKLLDDLTWVYLKLGGRSKLLKLMKKDEKLRTHFLRLMLTLEVKKELEGNKGSRGKGEFGSDGKRQKRNFFMIFRGLHEGAEKKLVDGLASGKIGPEAIESILNPQQDDYSKPLPEGPLSFDDIPFMRSDDGDEVSEEELEKRMKEARAELGDLSEELLEEAL